MSQIIKNYNDAVVDCFVLTKSAQTALEMGDLDEAYNALTELTTVTEKWGDNIAGLMRVLKERGATKRVATLTYYWNNFSKHQRQATEMFAQWDELVRESA